MDILLGFIVSIVCLFGIKKQGLAFCVALIINAIIATFVSVSNPPPPTIIKTITPVGTYTYQIPSSVGEQTLIPEFSYNIGRYLLVVAFAALFCSIVRKTERGYKAGRDGINNEAIKPPTAPPPLSAQSPASAPSTEPPPLPGRPSTLPDDPT